MRYKIGCGIVPPNDGAELLPDGIFFPETLLQVLKSAEALYVLGGRLAVFVAVTLINELYQ